jgi:hypothetical protein
VNIEATAARIDDVHRTPPFGDHVGLPIAPEQKPSIRPNSVLQ